VADISDQIITIAPTTPTVIPSDPQLLFVLQRPISLSAAPTCQQCHARDET